MKFISNYKRLNYLCLILITLFISITDFTNAITIKKTEESKNVLERKGKAKVNKGVDLMKPVEGNANNLGDAAAKLGEKVEVVDTKTFPELWKDIFTTTDRPPKMQCKVALNIKFIKTKLGEPDGLSTRVPKAKPNVYYKQYGYENAAYFFDSIDYLLQEPIVSKFMSFWNEMKQVPPDGKVEDKYALVKQVNAYYAQTPGLLTAAPKQDATDEELAAMLKKYVPSFNLPLFKGGINMAQLSAIYEKQKWKAMVNRIDWEKQILDKYDWNGDGTLSAREFFFLLVWENREDLNNDKIQLPFKKIFDEIIDPIFYFIDCDNNDLINAENIWNAFRYLKKTPDQAKKYNIYTCLINHIEYRTLAPDDFILKNINHFDGYLNINDFRRGMILGYWDRHIMDNEIILDNTKSLKNLRWENEQTDIECERIKSFARHDQ